MELNNLTQGFSERILREVIATPAMKELILLALKDIKPETAPGLVKTLLWGDPGVSMSLFGALPDFANWLLELLLELGRQLNGLPEPLLKDILGQIGKGIDSDRLKQFPSVYAQLANRLLFGDAATAEEKRAAIISALNVLLAGFDDLTAPLESRRQDIGRSLATGIKELDTAALGRSLRRLGLVAATAARGSGEGERKAVKGAAVAGGLVVGVMALRMAIKRARG